MKSNGLPVENCIPALRAALKRSTLAALSAAPGSGKSTVLPLYLLEEPWLQGKQILMLQPRRIAAQSIAARLAELSGTELGQLIGYHVRFDRKASKQTRIEVITEGILTRRLQADPALEEIGLIIFDEFHERSLHAELALALGLDAQHALRPDLRILLMSATLDPAEVSRIFPEAELIALDVPHFPLDLRYTKEEPSENIAEVAAREALNLMRAEGGDALIFLPGVGEIKRAMEIFEKRCAEIELPIRTLPLYGELPYTAQREALRRISNGTRRAVFATPIAETSLTLDGVRLVIDSGLARVPRFDPGYGLTQLFTERIALDSADQRAGRAARQEPGIALRLWTKHTQEHMRKLRSPEISGADLAPLLLEVGGWGTEPEKLRWYTAPPEAALLQARQILFELEALDKNSRITALGRELLSLGVHPRIGMLVLRGKAIGAGTLACDIAAILEERDPQPRASQGGADLDRRLEALIAFRKQRRTGADHYTLQRIDKISRDLQHRAGLKSPAHASHELAGALLAFAFPERIAQRRESEGNQARYVLAGGIGAKLGAGDALGKSPLLGVARLGFQSGDSRIDLAAALSEKDLREYFGSKIKTERLLAWDPGEQAVICRTVERIGAIELKSTPLTAFDPEELLEAFVGGVALLGVSALPWNDAARNFQARVNFLKSTLEDADLPDLSDAALTARLPQLLAPFCLGMRRKSDLNRINLLDVLAAELNYNQQKFLAAQAPESLQLPKGKQRKVDYAAGQLPVLSATVQELFGWSATPRIAGGKVPVLLHILSPARRPVQVTQDLAGFWQNSYRDVRRDLRGRYPKHKWPEDPTE